MSNSGTLRLRCDEERKMLTTLMRRLRREEEGYALVISMLLLAIMSVLLVVALKSGTSSLNQSSQGVEWSKTLTIAEAGVNDSVTRLGEDRNATNPCAISTVTVCTGGGGQYQVSWTQTGSKLVITSVGYYPTKTSPKFKREIQVTYQPVPSFRYAIFSQTGLTIANGARVVGDIYSDGDVSVGQNATICGSILSSTGGVSLQNGGQVLTDYPAYGCSGKSGQVWTGGTAGIIGASSVVVQGGVKAGAPSTVTCSAVSTNYGVSNASGGNGFQVNGSATACGGISGISGATSTTPGTATSPPVPVTFPQFTFDPNNYSSDPSNPLHLQCYPSGGTCGSDDSTTAIGDFNAYIATHKTSLTGTFAVWQRSPAPMNSSQVCDTASTTQICLDGITLSGDFTLVTNSPVDFGNTSTITTTAGSSNMVVVSTYQPNASTTCDVNGGDCSIYGQNSVEYDSGVVSDPNDGVVGLLYTTGKMAFKNGPQNIANPGEGALYASSMDLKNGYDIIYNSRVERVLGFGTTLQQVLWQELNT
jgi:Tfp pilus assembly protein PilX